jgi:hypothetical protein
MLWCEAEGAGDNALDMFMKEFGPAPRVGPIKAVRCADCARLVPPEHDPLPP